MQVPDDKSDHIGQVSDPDVSATRTASDGEVLPDRQALDQSIETLQAQRDSWARLPVARKVDYITEIMRAYSAVAKLQVTLSNQAKGIPEGTPLAGEEWAHPYLTVRLLRLLRDSLSRLATRGSLEIPRRSLRTRPGGQLAVRVFPVSGIDRLLYLGFRAEVWMQPGVTEANLDDNIAAFYRQRDPAGKVALVLGAGNVASIGPSDIVHKMFVEGQVCLFKHNPVNEYLAPVFEEAFRPLVRDGYLRFATGGVGVGNYLCTHPGIDEIHLTGSDRTYEAIVFGTGGEGAQRKRVRQPCLKKRVTCELGNVTPLIIVPGRWSESDIRFHAENVATQMINNCGFNCLAAKVLVLHKEWRQSEIFLNSIREVLASAPSRKAYYPGAEERYDKIISANPHAEAMGTRSPGVLPYTIIADLDPAETCNPCFATECFMPLLAQTSLPGADAREFLQNAVEFCNKSLWGTLSASIVVHPRERRSLGGELEQAISRLRYGTVSVNHWTALGYVWASPTWGAYPGHTPDDIQSGVGKVHNTFLLDRPEKSVVYAPFRVWPKPSWYLGNRQTHRVFRQMVELESQPGYWKALRIGLAALRG